jgi:hypothetical protein
MVTSDRRSRTSASSTSARAAASASTGRLYVQMPTASRGSSTGACGAYQPASRTTVSLSAVTSNQYQPPSMNGARSRSNSTVRSSAPGCDTPVTCIDSPSALERWTSIRQVPETVTRSTIEPSTLHRRQ